MRMYDYDLVLELECSDPLYVQLYSALRDRIVRGELRPGTRLPATRTLAKRLGVSRSVVVASYAQLTDEGFAYAHVGAGTFVRYPESDDRRQSREAPETGSSDRKTEARFPRLTRRLLSPSDRGNVSERDPDTRDAIDFGSRRRARSLDTVAFEEPVPGFPLRKTPSDEEPLGSPVLRRALSELLWDTRGIHCQASQVVVTRDSRQALDFLASLLLQPNTPVMIEDPDHPSVQRIFGRHGAALTPCSVTEDGLDVATAPQGGMTPLLIHVAPTDQFPIGSTMSLTRRHDLLEWSRANESLVIENSLEATMQQGSPTPPWLASLDGAERVIHIGSLPDVPTPELRLSFVVLPDSLVEPAEALSRKTRQPVLGDTQRTVAQLIRNGFYERLAKRAERHHARLRSVLAREIENQFGEEVRLIGGLASPRATLLLPDWSPDEERALVDRAREFNVAVTRLSSFYIAAAPHTGLVLGYGALSEESVRQGIRRLRQAWRKMRASREAVTH